METNTEKQNNEEQKLQPTTHLELNIDTDVKNVCGLSALFEVCLFA